MTPPLAVTMGEPAGIGPDLLLTLYARRAERGLPAFVVFGSADFLRARAARLGLDIAIETLGPNQDAATEFGHIRFAEALFAKALPVHDIAGTVADRPGEIVASTAETVIEAIAAAVRACLSGVCRGLVTAPIHKGALYRAGFSYPGHTEYLAALCAETGAPAPVPVMMLAHEDLRVVPLTIHVPLKQVPAAITATLLMETLRVLERDLRRRFGVERPQIGVTGLNPHAGEGGAMGREEVEIIAPTLVRARSEGIECTGPLPADTLFHPPHWRRYDAVLAMYHDQALIPIKTAAFDAAVNVTLGLPVLRTSPDHGTALDLAGSGRGAATSFAAALALARRLTATEP